MMSESAARLAIRARKISLIWRISGRVLASARTLTRTSSRAMVWPSLKSMTSTTFTSLLSCFVQRSSAASSPLSTIVIRESEASWVGATLSESMLKPRPEIMPATRARTPNLFSTRTEIVWRMIWRVSRRSAGQSQRTADYKVNQSSVEKESTNVSPKGVRSVPAGFCMRTGPGGAPPCRLRQCPRPALRGLLRHGKGARRAFFRQDPSLHLHQRERRRIPAHPRRLCPAGRCRLYDRTQDLEESKRRALPVHRDLLAKGQTGWTVLTLPPVKNARNRRPPG